MKNIFLSGLLILSFLTLLNGGIRAQFGSVQYSQYHTNGQTATAQCTAYGTFKGQLNGTNCYLAMTVRGDYDQTGITSSDPTNVGGMRNALNTTATYSGTDAGHTWHLCGSRYSGEFWLDPPSSCSGANCPNPGYLIRPCIGNSNWGGVNTPTCSAPSQNMELIFWTFGGTVTAADSITGPSVVCAGDTYTYSLNGVNIPGGFTWTVPSGTTVLSGAGSSSITVVAGPNGGTYGLTATTTCTSNIAIDTKSVTIAVPASQGINDTIIGVATACEGDTLTYTIDTTTGLTSHTWSVPSGSTILSGQGTTTIMVVAGANSGEVSVVGSWPCGPVVFDTVAVSFLGTPASAGPITGMDTVCQGASATYTVAALAGATSYTWSGPAGSTISSGQGSSTITLVPGSQSGWLIVDGTTPCGSVNLDSFYVNVDPLPSSPTGISGSGSLCAGDTTSYMIASVSGVTSYNWMVPTGTTVDAGQGSNQISITAGTTSGNVIVEATNGCGSSNLDTLVLTINTIPAIPGPVSGPNSVCMNDTAVYMVPFTSGLTYTWSAPTGATVNAGQGTNQATIIFGTTDGNVSVMASNTCGNSAPADLAVTLDSCLTGLLEGLTDLPAVLYPNPSNGHMKVSFNQNTGNLTMQVLTLHGQVLQTQTLGAARMGSEVNLDLSKLSNGVYLLKIADGETGLVRRIEIIR
ncbi:MAG: T9SS type A sorting domain-containing protein [Bacteroidia bacterium]|nr:T9SS type A sorting domain-containing protein [Bacteroidia bacterium]